MSDYRLGPNANKPLDEIYEYTAIRWGAPQAERYLAQLFTMFAQIAERQVVWRVIAPNLKISGYSAHAGSHIIYWREDAVAGIEIMSILHRRMN